MVNGAIPFNNGPGAHTIIDDELDALTPVRDGFETIVNIALSSKRIGEFNVYRIDAKNWRTGYFLFDGCGIRALFPGNIIC